MDKGEINGKGGAKRMKGGGSTRHEKGRREKGR